MKKNNREYGVVLYVHPYEKSFSAAMKETAEKSLKAKELDVITINIAKEDYDPIGNINPTEKFKKELKEYQNIIKEAKEIVVVYPTWWSSMPAHMDSFLNDVLAEGVFFENKNGVAKALPNNIRCVFIFTTTFTINLAAMFMLRNANKNRISTMFRTIGADRVVFKNLERVSASAKRRVKFLNKMSRIIGGRI